MQRTLFDPPAAHGNDPATSHEAAERVTASGRRARHAATVLALVAAHPGLTAIELWDVAPPGDKAELAEPQEVRRRLTDLLHRGAVRQGPARRCRVRGTSMVVWEVA